MRWVRKLTIGLLLFITAFFLYTFYVNRNSINMTPRQKVLKAVYPVWMWFTQLAGKNSTILKNAAVQPPVSFYSQHATASDGSTFNFSVLQGKKVLIVNTASDCGYTEQYDGLEKLYQQYKGSLEIIAFPANDFKQQEKGNDAAIAEFCKKNYGVSFPIMAKTAVIKTGKQNAVFNWLTNPASNGWNSKAPSWNFCKYLINEKGQLTHYFGSGISPLSAVIAEAVN